MTKMQSGEIVAVVSRKEYITPHFIRIFLYSEELLQFKETAIGDNNKIVIPPPGMNEVHFPTIDEYSHQWIYPPKEVAPTIRTYTHRGVNWQTNELYIDFVDHGDTGPASKWAREAKKGSKLGVMMRTESKKLYPADAQWYFLIGDATAIPVLSIILESLPKQAKGVCIIEVHNKLDEQNLRTAADIKFIWNHNSEPHLGNKLTDVVRNIKIPNLKKYGYVACESSTVKEIRSYLRNERLWTSAELNAYSYWKAGISEDESKKDIRRE
ncbi:MAG: siderophore-interacting protein [Flavobacteriaceae bacterium]|jgi:NADPH-dependent ferric siderophore reductase|nr:siderophore-interacting protein [Flavobacteriaceae bacterium]